MPIAGIDYPITNSVAGPLVINTNQISPAVLFSYLWANAQNVIIEFSIIRGSITEVGRMMISTDGSSVSFSTDRTEKQDTGISFFPVLSGPSIEIQYNSDNSGGNANFWYSTRILFR